MTRKAHPDASITRRGLVASAAAGALTVAAVPAAAQRCPSPAHVRGPVVWMDMDQKELDDAYDQIVYAPNQPNINERRAANSAAARERLGPPMRIPYGATAIEEFDVFRTQKQSAPVVIFIHGGAWRGGRASDSAYLAEPYVKAGAHFVILDFINVTEAGGSLFPMVAQICSAVAWLHDSAGRFGGDPNRLYLIGHSSGGHLGGCVVTTDWQKRQLPPDIIKGAVLGSGMYDLKPVRLSKRGNYVKFTDAMEEEFSAQRHIDRLNTPLILTHGSLETPEFQRQSRDFHAAVKAAGKPIELRVGRGYNHYETQETLANPYGFMGRAAMEMLGLAV